MASESAGRPNVVFIMTDDVGWGDLGCYGGGVMRGAPTPNLDRMAAEGMRFVNYYGQASCTAGRASFVTGRVPIRTSLSSVLAPGDPNGLTRQTRTIAQFFKEAGYRTVELGKWHLGDRQENFPTANGFDEMYHMLPYYAGVYAYDDLSLHPNFPRDDPKFLDLWNSVNLSEWEGTAGSPATISKRKFAYGDLATGDDNIRATAISWIQDHASDPEPFSMYLNFQKVHNPNNPSPRWKGKSPGGGNYLDSVMELDDNSGQILDAIKALPLAEDTIVIWTADNGAWIDAWPDAGYSPFRGMKGSPFEGGFRVPCLAWWPGHVAPGTVNTDMFAHMDWWPTLGRIAGLEPPPREWADNDGNPVLFDGIDLSETLLGTGPGRRESFVYFNDQSFGGLRVKHYKMLFTAKDTWLGPELPLKMPAIYNLLWDPAEQYDMTFNGAAPGHGEPRTSPGRYSGADKRLDSHVRQPRAGLVLGGTQQVPQHSLPALGAGLWELIPPAYR